MVPRRIDSGGLRVADLNQWNCGFQAETIVRRAMPCSADGELEDVTGGGLRISPTRDEFRVGKGGNAARAERRQVEAHVGLVESIGGLTTNNWVTLL